MRVSVRDLDGEGEGRASVSPDHLQPGDPEIRIPAPPDAESVIVDFPFGESKSAVWEDDARGGSWVARFLVDEHTPDGTYEIVVRVTYAGGRVQILHVPYVVDTLSPQLEVEIRPAGRGRFEIVAQQRLTDAEIAELPPSAEGSQAPRQERMAAVLTDARRVEVQTPDGQSLSLTPIRLGTFRGTWTPRTLVAPHAKLRLVVADRALNERAMEVEVP
jgi:Ca-activated chloride channel family protein